MSATFSLPASLPETISEHPFEGVGLDPAEEMAATSRKKLFRCDVVFLAYLCAVFTVALLICSGIADFNDHQWAVRHQLPSFFVSPNPALCFIAAPFTLFYIIVIILSSLFPSKYSPEISPIKFGCMNVAYATFLTILWGFSASENADRVGKAGVNELRMHIAILGAVQTVFLSLMCVAFLHEIWKSLPVGGNGYTRLPRIRVMVGDTLYIDSSHSGLFKKLDRVLNVERQELAPVGLNNDIEKHAEQV